MIALKAIFRVTAGVIPGTLIPEHTKQWNYTSEDYEKDCAAKLDEPTIFSTQLGEAHEYAKRLSNPAYLNWVKVDWVWI
jgi:hypothetical protein